MKKGCFTLSVLALSIQIVFTLVSCNEESDFPLSVENSEMKGIYIPEDKELLHFTESDEFSNFKRLSGLEDKNFDFDNSVKDYDEENSVTQILIRVQQNGKLCGLLRAFDFGNGVYTSIYEDWTQAESDGVVEIMTGDGYGIASFSVCREDGIFHSKILKVEEKPQLLLKYQSPNQRKAPKGQTAKQEQWTQCVSRTYKAATKACSGDGWCSFLCDAVNYAGGGQCTGAMIFSSAASCAIAKLRR